MDSFTEYSNISKYWLNSFQKYMECIYFYHAIKTYEERLSIYNQFPVMMSVIK